MGKTFVIFKIIPKDMDEIDKAVAEVKAVSNGEVKEVEIEEIGFGIKLIKAGIVIPEKNDAISPALEKELSELPSIESAEVEGMTLV